jgi:hypothetical protein
VAVTKPWRGGIYTYIYTYNNLAYKIMEGIFIFIYLTTTERGRG